MMGSMTSGGFETVLDYLTGEILAGRVGTGGRLPNERELAAQLGASRSAVREAIKVLQAQGVVTSATGPSGGTRVGAGQGMAFGRMLKLHVALEAVSFAELTETRVVLERAAATAAIGGTGLDEVERLAAEMVGVTDAANFNELDTAFHLAIAAMGENRLIRDMTIAIREAVADRILSAEERLADWEGLRRRLVSEHDGIVQAIREGDAHRAADACEAHIRRAHEALG